MRGICPQCQTEQNVTRVEYSEMVADGFDPDGCDDNRWFKMYGHFSATGHSPCDGVGQCPVSLTSKPVCDHCYNQGSCGRQEDATGCLDFKEIHECSECHCIVLLPGTCDSCCHALDTEMQADRENGYY